jgi:transmembrane sensor
MKDDEEKISAAIAEQAGERFVANDAGPLAAHESEALAAWLKASPVHVEEFLGVSVIARDLRELRGHPRYSLDAVLEDARGEDDTVQPLGPQVIEPFTDLPSRRWQTAAVALAACLVLSLGVLIGRSPKPTLHVAATRGAAALHLETGHGEQLTRRLTDNSVLHLNTDSAVTIRYDSAERLVELTAGEASFEVAHEPNRAFRVFAGSAQVVAVGTNFDVRLEQDAAVVTVVEGRVNVGPSAMSENRGASSNENQPGRFVALGADQQARLIAGEWPPTVKAVDAQRATAWLHRQISFDHEPLERVAAEYNRYARKPIEITTPALRTLLITGAFATDDPEEFIAFLRSLKGVRVEVTATQIRVSGG